MVSSVKIALVTTLTIDHTYWQGRSGFADMYGCVLRSKIQNVKTIFPTSDFIIITNVNDSRDETLLRIANESNTYIRTASWDTKWTSLRESSKIECCDKNWENTFFPPQMLKIEALNMHQYDYVVYSDLDVFFDGKINFDVAFPNSKVQAFAGGSDSKPLHGGFMILKPTPKNVEYMKDILTSGFSKSAGWKGTKCTIQTKWDWFAASADEGIFYAAFACHDRLKSAGWSVMQKVSSHSHYFGHGKPWEKQSKARTHWCKKYFFPPAPSLQCNAVCLYS